MKLLIFSLGILLQNILFASTNIPRYFQKIATDNGVNPKGLYALSVSISGEKINNFWVAWPWKIYTNGKSIKLSSQLDLIKYLQFDKTVPFGLFGLTIKDYQKAGIDSSDLALITAPDYQVKLGSLQINGINEAYQQALIKKYDISPLKTKKKAKKYRTIPRSEKTELNIIIAENSKRFNVSKALIKAIIRAESGFNPNAKSPVGARGLMQVMPSTARGMQINPKHLFNPSVSVYAGTKYIAQQIKTFKSLELALAAYNAGPGAVRKYKNKIPPYKETQTYVKRVKRFYRYYQKVEKGEVS